MMKIKCDKFKGWIINEIELDDELKYEKILKFPKKSS